MALKTRRLDLNSIRINRTFLGKLGDILEQEIATRKSMVLQEIEGLKNEAKREIDSYKIYTKSKKQKILKSRFELIEKTSQPHYKISYTINAKGEELEYSSMKELLSLNTFPPSIYSMTLRINHFESSFVDVSITFDNDLTKTALVLSSENEANMLKKEKETRDLCRDHKTFYAFIYQIPYFSLIGIFGLVGLFSYFATSTIFDNFSRVPIFKNISISQNWFIPIFAILFIAGIKSFNSLLPKYWFDLSNQNWIRISAGTIILAIIAAAVYDLIKIVL